MESKSSEIAIEYYRALRTEIVARFQMRDQIVIAYLGASGALLGFGLKQGSGPSGGSFLPYLLVLLPFLSLGAISMVAQHQDQITAYYQFFCTELRSFLSDTDKRVTMFYLSKAAQEHTGHMLKTLFISQLLIMCGPPVLVLILNVPYSWRHWSEKESMLLVGLGLTSLVAWRTVSSMRYRTSVMRRLFALRHPDTRGD